MASVDKRPTRPPADTPRQRPPEPKNPVPLPPLDMNLITYIEKGGHPPLDSETRVERQR